MTGTAVETCNCIKGTILYIGGFELPDKNAAAHRVLANAKLFRLLGYRTVFVGVTKECTGMSDILQTRTEIQGFPAFSVPYPKGLNQWFEYITDISRYIKVIETIQDLKAVVCYNFQSVALEKMRRYCKKRGLVCAADVTEWYTGRGRNLPIKIIKGFDTFYRMRIVQKRLDGLIVISRFLEDYYRNCKNVVRIPPLTDLSDAKWRHQGEKAKDVLKLVYAGSPGQKDRIDLLIEALQSVKRGYQLDVVGIDEAAYLSMHPEHQEFLKNCNKIKFHGRVAHTTALSYVKGANYSCFFRLKDRVTTAGFPTKFSEAITCGTPVITNETSNVGDYIRNGENGVLVEPLTPEAIAAALENAQFAAPVDSRLFDYRQYQKYVADERRTE